MHTVMGTKLAPFALLLWLAGGALQPAHANVVDRIAAVVNDEVIALSEVYDIADGFIDQRCQLGQDACVREAELEVVDSLILRVLVRQELTRLGLDVTGQEVDRAIDSIAEENGFGDREGLRREVERSGSTWEAYREQVVTQQLRQMKFDENILRPRLAVSEDELVDLYNRTVRGVEGPTRREISGLALSVLSEEDREGALSLASDLVTRINAGELAWDDAVAEHHTGVIAAADGTMGSFEQGDLTPKLDEPVFATPVGQVVGPVDLGHAVMVLYVKAEHAASVRSFDEAKDELRGRLYEVKLEEELDRWYTQARRRASVQILLEEP